MRRPSGEVGGELVGHSLRQRDRPVAGRSLGRLETDGTARSTGELLIDPHRPCSEVSTCSVDAGADAGRRTSTHGLTGITRSRIAARNTATTRP